MYLSPSIGMILYDLGFLTTHIWDCSTMTAKGYLDVLIAVARTYRNGDLFIQAWEGIKGIGA